MKGQITLLVGIFLSITLSAQDDVSQFFDDDGISDPDNAFKIDIIATAGGEFTLLYERFFTDELSLEVGAGFALGRGVEPLFTFLDTEQMFTNRGGGFKFLLNPRYHPWGDRREGLIFGINFFVRNLTDVEYTGFTTDRKDTFIGLYQGYQWEIGSRMSIELGYHAGLLLIEVNNQARFLENSRLNLGFSCKLAYHK
ncbi:hypothetical protein G3O08_15495 [Cryomorpha ignava]|uniref:DUF3575 domain-containing protein n=1 Tax=Cryomorpha ignava TaxID=101383 RepID=A0A7K3WWC3_9FLAO|nr:hypothetical protein [Cryomorpha ignava]NEN24905.1 hypothetical protein [Cryomorpha ignava]